MSEFVHLHVHTQFSLLDGASQIKALVEKAAQFGMTSLAITDHGNMFGVMQFINEANKRGIKPIIGCELYVAAGSRFDKRSKEDRSGYHLILLAKNKTGYHNLSRLVSKGYIEGFYYTPRVDKELLKEYSEGIIALSACLGGEVPKSIIKSGYAVADSVVKEFKEIYGDDYYLEVQDHGLPEQHEVNSAIFELSASNNIKMVVTNDVHFINKEEHQAHHILICLNTGRDLTDNETMNYSGNEYLKSVEEMKALFPDAPELLSNTLEIASKVEEYSLKHDIILPVFPIPKEFKGADEYLRHLTFQGAATKYEELTSEVKDRLDYELSVIERMGYAGYFLIVQDFISEARRRNVLVGPGRGSAAGSAVAYSIGITNIEPIKYNLLFERFLNPERQSMPDIDIDFDDYGRDDIIEYVINKYGHDKVAQIITFGSMASRSAIRDVARVLKLPLPEADRLAKMVPDSASMNLKKALKENPDLADELKNGDPLVKKTLRFALTLEGSVRQTGTHACGVIIGPDALIDHIPLCTQKDTEMIVTQYDGRYIENAGMLKMDFLGLKTLSIIKDTIIAIQSRYDKKIIIDKIPLDDENTYRLFQNGNTMGIFQFESEGMQTHLKELKPEGIEDLIAMNALYRPGPMSFIQVYIDRKHGRKPVEYPHKMLIDVLKNTYGIMVYQEQIMQCAQIMGGFTLGEADILRKAVGKKDMETMKKQRKMFIHGAKEKGIGEQKAGEVFETMLRFAEYGFNRSHSTAYSVLAYQTAYLKANYPAEFMAAVLTHNLSDIKKITELIDACNRMGIKVNGPDINQSDIRFSTNDDGEIVFGLGAIKGVGENAAKAIIDERTENRDFLSVFDFVKRVPLTTVNKRCVESMAMAGVFDGLGDNHRAQFFYNEGAENTNFIEKLLKFGSLYQQQNKSAQKSLFGDMEEVALPALELPKCDAWPAITQLGYEKDVIGFYISGHPLDEYSVEIKTFCRNRIEEIRSNMRSFLNIDFHLGVIVSDSNHKFTKAGRPYGSIKVEDYSGTMSFSIFGETYLKYKHLLNTGEFLYIKGTVSNKYSGTEELDFRIREIKLLHEILDKQVNAVTISVEADDIQEDDKLADKILDVVKTTPGNAKVKVWIKDNEYSLLCEMIKKRVSPSDFIKKIRDIETVKYQGCEHLK